MNVVVAIAQNLMIIVFESNSISHHSLSSFYLAFFSYLLTFLEKFAHHREKQLLSVTEWSCIDVRHSIVYGQGVIYYPIQTVYLVRKISKIDTQIWTFLIQSGCLITFCLNSNFFLPKLEYYWQIPRPLACITCINILTNETNICRYKVISVEIFLFAFIFGCISGKVFVIAFEMKKKSSIETLIQLKKELPGKM